MPNLSEFRKKFLSLKKNNLISRLSTKLVAYCKTRSVNVRLPVSSLSPAVIAGARNLCIARDFKFYN